MRPAHGNSKEAQALRHLRLLLDEHGAVAMPCALARAHIYSKAGARAKYREWLKRGILNQPDALGGVYTPGPRWPKEIIMNISDIKTLDQLAQAIKDGVINQHEYDFSDLPNFGGVEPEDTAGIWSWDEDRLLLGEGDLEIVTREEYADLMSS